MVAEWAARAVAATSSALDLLGAWLIRSWTPPIGSQSRECGHTWMATMTNKAMIP